MSESKPPPWFTKAGAPTPEQEAEAKRREAALREQLPELLNRAQNRGRAQKFQPYLLIRSVLGDRGDRPINVPFWESPDIWTAPGSPADAPAIPPDHGGVLVARQPNTIYAHVWNLGFAPLAGVCVEFYWSDPSLGIDGAHVHLIGVARTELAGRGSPNSHRLVKCPKAWTPVMENGGHECIVVRVSGFGDAVGNNPWAPWLNRHVGQRNVSVIAQGAALGRLVESLNRTRVLNSRLELVQLSHAEGQLARTLVAPKLQITPSAHTQLLGEIGVDGAIGLPAARAITPAMMSAVHPMAHGVTVAPPRILDAAPIVPLGNLATVTAPVPATQPGHLANLLTRVPTLHVDRDILAPPARGEAHIVRVANYVGEQLVGGYTMVVTSGA
jgi:hypothetical protein